MNRPPPNSPDETQRGDRLQKVLAAAGLGSRRECEDFIRAGRVEVDRKTVTELGTRVDPASQEIRVDGESIRSPQRLYFAVNKPVGVVTTNNDPSGRARVIDLVPTEERVFAVGRLDRSSEGLILVTNDGEFANRLTHPRYGVEKTYLVRIAGSPEPRQLERLKKGVHLAEGFARAQSITVKKQHGQSTDLVIVLNEGRNREIRRILARVGHKVLTLKRIAVGNVKLAELPLGGWRRLMPAEVTGLLQLAKQKRRVTRGTGASSAKKPTRRATEDDSAGISAGAHSDEQYVQKQALLDQPLSLDDLLRDDLDEGPLSILGPDESGSAAAGGSRGDVIEYHDEFSAPDQKRQRAPRFANSGQDSRRPNFKNRRGKQTARGRDPESQPRDSFGKKRGGKTIMGPREARGGSLGEKAANFRFRPSEAGDERQSQNSQNRKPGKPTFRPKFKKKKLRAGGGKQQYGTDNQRRGDRRNKADKQTGTHGGKRKGRR